VSSNQVRRLAFIFDSISLIKGYQGGRRVVQSSRAFIKEAISLVKRHQSGRRVVQSSRAFIFDSISNPFGVGSSLISIHIQPLRGFCISDAFTTFH